MYLASNLANLERIEHNPELCMRDAIFLRVVDATPESKFRVKGLHVSKSRTSVVVSKLHVDVVDGEKISCAHCT